LVDMRCCGSRWRASISLSCVRKRISSTVNSPRACRGTGCHRFGAAARNVLSTRLYSMQMRIDRNVRLPALLSAVFC
jgi:hypothetical protein